MTTQNAPGKHWRQGITLAQLFTLFPDDDAAEAWFARLRWPDGPTCPHCNCDNVQHPTTHPSMPYRCRGCRRFFSVRVGTVMQDSKLGYQVWAIAIYQMTTNLKSVSSMKLHRDLGVTQKTAWFLAHRLRETWCDKLPEMFTGPVEVDETYVGGLERNKHHDRRLGSRHPEGKTPVIGMRDRASGRVSAQPVAHADSPTARAFIAERTRPRTMVYTDESNIYDRVFPHRTVAHTRGQYTDGQAHTNGIESFWAVLKRAHKGTFHVLSAKHLHRYVNEFAGRHNTRPLDTDKQMASIARGLEGKRLTYRELVSDDRRL